MRAFALVIGFGVPACTSGGGDDAAKGKIASELVTCKNERNNLKEQLAEAKAALDKVQAQLNDAQTVKLDPLTVQAHPDAPKRKEGNIPPEAVLKVVRQNSSGFRTCYEHALKRSPDLRFIQSVTARFAVKNSGSATNISFSPRTDADMERCMSATMEKWHFPPFQGDPVMFEQPISLVTK